jgi:hypothetical protein
VRTAITRPARTIVENAGEEGSVVVGKLLDSKEDFNFGYNAATGEYCDMIAAGILDPLKVVKTALLDASGVASLLTTSEACVVEAPEDKPAPAMPGGGGGGMGKLLTCSVSRLTMVCRRNGRHVLATPSHQSARRPRISHTPMAMYNHNADQTDESLKFIAPLPSASSSWSVYECHPNDWLQMSHVPQFGPAMEAACAPSVVTAILMRLVDVRSPELPAFALDDQSLATSAGLPAAT